METYRLCAQLLLEELERLRGGRRALASMVNGLTRAQNWQTAFQVAFRHHFGRLLEVEQWWAVALHQFVGQVQQGSWTVERIRYSLEEALVVMVEVQDKPTDPPRRQLITLQEIIRGWSPSVAGPVLRSKLAQLRMVEVNAPPHWAALASAYAAAVTYVLDSYRTAAASPSVRLHALVSPRTLTMSALRQLDRLDAQRRELGSASVVPTTSGGS